MHLFPRGGALTKQHEFRKYNRLGIARSFTCQTTTHGKHANHLHKPCEHHLALIFNEFPGTETYLLALLYYAL